MARGPGWFDMGRAAHLVHFISSDLADSERAPRATFNAKTFYRFPESVRNYNYTIGNYPSKKGCNFVTKLICRRSKFFCPD